MTGPSVDWPAIERATAAVFERLDWQALGDVYFHDEGEHEWQQRLPRVVACGLELAKGLLARLPADGRSLWVGAGVAELPVLLAEASCGRDVVACNLIARECELLQAGLDGALPGSAVQYRAVDAAELAQQRGFDHVGCISVFTDPERWPALSGVTYGRLPPVQLDLATFAAERDEARALATALADGLDVPGWITTTADEVSWFLEQAERRGCDVDASEELYDTAVVGDPVGFLRLTARA